MHALGLIVFPQIPGALTAIVSLYLIVISKNEINISIFIGLDLGGLYAVLQLCNFVSILIVVRIVEW